jgi:hypothetical protein
MKKLFINFSISLFSVILVLVAISIFLRYTHLFGARLSFSTPDEEVVYRFVPHKRYWNFKENDHPITGRFNRFGWRDTEWALEKPMGEYRIAVLGDSFVESFQVECEKSFLNLAEKDLTGRSELRFELMNFGRASYAQTEELIILEKEVLKFKPDMVMLFFLPGNDIADISRETAPNTARPFFVFGSDGQLTFDNSFKDSPKFKIRKKINALKQRSILFSLITERFNSVLGQSAIKQAENNTHKVSEGYLSLCTSRPGAAFTRSYKLSQLLIKQMAAICIAKDIKFVLVAANTDAYKPKIEKRYKNIDPTFNPYFFEDDLKAFAQKIDIGFLGLQRPFYETYQKNGLDLHWGHWSYEGHKTVAKTIVRYLDDKVFGHVSGSS